MDNWNSFVSLDSFGLPLWRPQSAWIEHGPFALWLIAQCKPHVLVELGAFSGYSFAAFCQAMKATGSPGTAIAVDTWQGDEHGGFYGDRIYQDLKTHIDARYPFAQMQRMTFAEALPAVADGTIDLLHVDGRHFYDDVKEDYTTWIPKLSTRAVVLFHDTQVRDRGFGVYKYWSELESQHPTFEFHHGNGLGVLAFGPDAPASIKALCAIRGTATADHVRAAYARLGAGVDGIRAAEKETARKTERRAMRKAPHKALLKVIKKRFA
jgi:hypothetical protein